MKNIELLSPAGSVKALHAAVQSGADAVYLGGPEFNARNSADNFTLDDMQREIEYCHLYGVDVHVTVNTLVKENEFKSWCDYVCSLNDIGADALIIQDIGAAKAAHKLLPDMPLHASTQMTVTSLEGVKYLEKMGFSRVVLARELSKNEIQYICENSNSEIEVFAHGAICMCYSGQCLMSSILGGRSGNRGRCAQPCRLPYRIEKNGKKLSDGYLLSPKDMALINDIQELKDIGVTSLKIEGRLKRPEYVSAVIGIYRKYIDNTESVSDDDMLELKNAFSRSGFTNGYFTGKIGEEMMSHKTPGNVSDNKFSEEAKRRADESANVRKIQVSISAVIEKGQPVSVTIYDEENNYAVADGSINAEKATNKPLDSNRIKEQLLKLGQTPFEAGDVFVSVDEDATVPIKELNFVRREAVQKLIELRSSRPKKRKSTWEAHQYKGEAHDLSLSVEVYTLPQAEAAVKNGITRIYAPEKIADKIKTDNIEVITRLPDIFDKEAVNNNSVTVSSPAAIEFYGNKIAYGDFRLNVFNSNTANNYRNLKSVMLSPELNIHEIKALTENTDINAEVIGYGRLPLMIMRNCPLKSSGNCQHKSMIYSLKDRKNEEFPIICLKDCRAELLNSKPIYIADKINDLKSCKISTVRLRFTIENYDECEHIIRSYQSALRGEMVEKPTDNTFTRGHFYRGVL